MDAPKPTFGLPDLRRELEEILALLNGSAFQEPRPEQPPGPSSAQLEREPNPASECAAAKPEADRSGEPDELFDARPDELFEDALDSLFEDALEVVTEFGDASPAILQMWLSIDYSRAARIVSQLEAKGLVSPKGRVLHKAFELRRSSSRP